MKEPQFDKEYFERFSMVLSGLDNVEARRHVNRLCLSAGVPLIESGTEGYLGQVRGHVFDPEGGTAAPWAEGGRTQCASHELLNVLVWKLVQGLCCWGPQRMLAPGRSA